ncbi:MAG: tetratricopeptide repeat protein [Bryobacteraceae bacterium]
MHKCIIFLLLTIPGALLAQLGPSCPDTNPYHIFDASSRVAPTLGTPNYDAKSVATCALERRHEPNYTAGAANPRGAVSLRRLTHKPSKPARKEFEAAMKSSRKGDAAGSLEHLRKAVELDPAFVEARNNLGARLYQAGRYEDAVTELETAASADPHSAEITANYAVALAAVGRNREGESWARKSYRLDPDSPRTAYILAFTLMKQNRGLGEARDLLAGAVETYESARPLFNIVRAQMGETPPAGPR